MLGPPIGAAKGPWPPHF